MSETSQVMISCSWGHENRCQKLKDALTQEGYNVLMDEGKAEGDMDKGMTDAVENAFVILMCISHRYQASPYCEKVAELAVSKKKPIIPLKFEDFTPTKWLGNVVNELDSYDAKSDKSMEKDMPKIIEAVSKHCTAKGGDKEGRMTAWYVVGAVVAGVLAVALAMYICQRSYKGDGPFLHDVEMITGDFRGEVKEGTGNVCLQFYGVDGGVSEALTYNCNFLSRRKHYLYARTTFSRIERLEVWINGTEDNHDLKWFVETFVFERNFTKTVFPFHQWVTTKRQVIFVDAVLPQFDKNRVRRREGIRSVKEYFKFLTQVGGIPVMANIEEAPPHEQFSYWYETVVFYKRTIVNIIKKFKAWILPSTWRELVDTTNVYGKGFLDFREPKCVRKYKPLWPEDLTDYDRTELDKIFADQRLTGANPIVIERIRSASEVTAILKVREGPSVTLNEMLLPQLEGLTIEQAVAKKRLYKVDYTEIMYDLPSSKMQYTVPEPVALFFADKNRQLMPIAIQLFKTPGEDNPIFLPSDDPYTWILAKMWFNNADAAYHQSASHLGFTHLLMESVYIAFRRSVSPSHPIFRLMAPHFQFLLNINSQAGNDLLKEDGWVDQSMSVATKGMLEIIRRKFEGTETVKPWRMNVDGNIENDIKARGVEDLPNYKYRDDALRVHRIMKKYVQNKIEETYKDVKHLKDDEEIQNFAELLIKDSKDGGCGIKGLAFNETIEDEDTKSYFSSNEEVIDTITSIIYICSAGHASVNFLQYDEYGYPLHYPALLRGDPPRTVPTNEKEARTQYDIMQALATRQETLAAIAMTDMLTQKETSPLGTFEPQYQLTREGNKPENVKRFREDLRKLSCEIKVRNEDDDDPYDVLDPVNIPNSISI